MAKSSKKKTQKKTVQKKDDNLDLNINFDSIKGYLPIISTICLLIFVMWFAFFIRSGSVDLDGLDERVESSIYSQIRVLITQEVNAEYPNINEVYSQELINERYQEVLDTGIYELQGQRFDVAQQVQLQVTEYKNNFKADNGQTYLTAIDPYFFLRKASNLQETGTVGDVVIDGVAYESRQLAPGLREVDKPNFHVWLEAKLLDLNGITPESSFGEKTSAVFALSAIIAMLSAIPCFFIIRKFSNDLFAFFGSMLLVSIGTYVSRTVAGFVDTDAYNVFFPLTIIAFLIYAFFARKVMTTLLLSVVAGFVMGLFLWTWPAAWFIFFFSIASILGYIASLLVVKYVGKVKDKTFSERLNNSICTFAGFFVSSMIFSFILISKNILTTTLNSVTGSLSGLAAISTSRVWPNVYSSVAELSNASFNSIVGAVGGQIIFILSMMGLLFLVLDFKAKNENVALFRKILLGVGFVWFIAIVSEGVFVNLTQNSAFLFLGLFMLPVGLGLLLNLYNLNTDSKIFLSILLTLWIAGTIFMSLNGVRFILLLAPAFAIAFAFSLYYVSNIANKFFQKEFKLDKGVKKNMFGFAIASLLFLFLFNPIAGSAVQISKSVTPNFDDSWVNAMEKIKKESSEDAIITSWWDFGHFFAAVAERGVTFDGGSQTTPQSHWVGKLLLESDEDVAHDILRMLVCGGNEAHDTMLGYTDGLASDTVKINKVLYTTFGKSKEEKRELIETNKYYTFTSEQVDEIMNYLHCDNPSENYLITSGDMVGKAAVWAHWGSWDFTKKYVRDNYKEKSSQEIALEIDEDVELIDRYVFELEAISQRAALGQNEDNLLNQWFAPYPGYAGDSNCNLQNITLVCGNGLEVNLVNGMVNTEVLSPEFLINNVIIKTPTGDVQVINQNQENAVYDVILVPTQNGVNAIIAQTPLGDSLFSKLFYLDGTGTSKFEKFHQVQTITTGKVVIWKTDWEENSQISDLEVQSVDSSN